MGNAAAKPTDRTPGIAASFSATLFSIRAAVKGLLSMAGGIAIRTVCTCAASANPGSTFRSAAKVRIISVAQTRSTSAMAT